MATHAHTKVTRDDWIAAALDRIEVEPIDQLKILTLAKELGVSRSSFYWYFDKPSDLQGELLRHWRHNTDSIVSRSERQTESAVEGCLAVFECWADANAYDATLDLSVRDWARRDESVAEQVAAADDERLHALTAMFARHGFDAGEALVRARLLYHSQVGYYAVGTDEPIKSRLAYLPYYLEAMAGAQPTSAELAAFEEFLRTVGQR